MLRFRPILLLLLLFCMTAMPAAPAHAQKKPRTTASNKKKTAAHAASPSKKGGVKSGKTTKSNPAAKPGRSAKARTTGTSGKTVKPAKQAAKGRGVKPASRNESAVLGTKKEELDRLRQEIRACEQRLEQARKKERNTREQIDEYNRQTALLRDLIARLKQRAEENRREIEASQQQLLSTEQRLRILQQRYARWIVNAYKRGKYHDTEILLSAGSLNQMLVRARYLKAMTQKQRTEAEEIRRVRGRITEQKTQLEAKLVVQKQTVAEKKSEESRLQQKAEEKRSLLGRIAKDREAAQAELRTKQAAAKKISQLIASLVERENAKRAADLRRRSSAGASTKGARKKSAAPAELPGKPISETAFGRLRGRLPWPVSRGSVVGGFGEQRHPELGTITINNGIDIGAAEGSPVRVVADGVVSVLFYIAGYGNLVIVNHDDDFRTVYARVNGIGVAKGQRVKAGQAIAKTAGGSAGSQVHFELWRGKQKQNPLNWLAGR